MFRKIIVAAIFGIGVAFVSGHADAAGLSSFARNISTAPSMSVHMAKTARVQACEIVAGQCANGSAVVPIAIAGERREELRQVSKTVNDTFGELDDYFTALAGPSFPVPVSTGECGDCAAAKRLELISLGWQANALRVAWSLSDNGALEKVLIVETGAGMIVLDNDKPAAVTASKIETLAL